MTTQLAVLDKPEAGSLTVAWMVAVPDLLPALIVACLLFVVSGVTVAISVSVDVHVTGCCDILSIGSLGRIVAVNVSVPTSGFKDIAVIGALSWPIKETEKASTTRTSTSFDTFLHVTVIFALPVATPVIRPLLLTVAMPGALVSQVAGTFATFCSVGS